MKPIASLSLDLDNKWSYLKSRGSAGWEAFPSYFDLVIPRILEFLGRRNLTITVFVVGQDAALESNRSGLRAVADAGHEIGNHSFKHEQWLHRYSAEEIEAELAKAEHHIRKATGRNPVGFRGPGFSMSSTTLQALRRRNYIYDATTCSNVLTPLARTYFLMTSNLNAEERRKQKAFFPGSFQDVFWPIKPFHWQTDTGTLIEIPVTTMPLVKLPIHFSYLLFLSGAGASLARAYFRFALALCKWTGTQPSLLLHPVDFISAEDDSDLSYFPAMKISSGEKLALLSDFLEILTEKYAVVTMEQHAQHVATSQSLAVFDVNCSRLKH